MLDIKADLSRLENTDDNVEAKPPSPAPTDDAKPTDAPESDASAADAAVAAASEGDNAATTTEEKPDGDAKDADAAEAQGPLPTPPSNGRMSLFQATNREPRKNEECCIRADGRVGLFDFGGDACGATLASDKWQRVTITVDTEAGVMTTYVGADQCLRIEHDKIKFKDGRFAVPPSGQHSLLVFASLSQSVTTQHCCCLRRAVRRARRAFTCDTSSFATSAWMAAKWRPTPHVVGNGTSGPLKKANVFAKCRFV